MPLLATSVLPGHRPAAPDDPDPANFESSFTPSNLKAVMRAAGATSRDLWQVPVAAIRVKPGFNVRVRDDEYLATVRRYADSMKAHGYYQDKPMTGIAAIENGESVVFVTDGHTRFDSLTLAISEGAQIDTVPFVPEAKGTSDEDITIALVRRNEGRPLRPHELAVVCKRLTRFGWDTSRIADSLGFSTTYVDGLLLFMSAPVALRDMVNCGELATTVAIEALRKHGASALAHLSQAQAHARANGSTRVTRKHLPAVVFARQVTKAAPALYNAARELRNDPAYSSMHPELRSKLDDLLAQLDPLEAAAQA